MGHDLKCTDFRELKKIAFRSRIKSFQKFREDLISRIWAKSAKICTLKVIYLTLKEETYGHKQ